MMDIYWYTLVDIRHHTGATIFYNRSSDLQALQQLGTWSNARMPQHYAKIMSTRAKEAIKRIEENSNGLLEFVEKEKLEEKK